MLFNSIDGFSLKTLKDISFFEMFGHIRFQPLGHLLIFVRYLAFGNNILLYHILNIALHVSAAFLVFLVLKAFLKDTRFPFIFGLLFITLPSQFDTVAWTYHIYIILGTMLALSTIFLVYRYVETEIRSTCSLRSSSPSYPSSYMSPRSRPGLCPLCRGRALRGKGKAAPQEEPRDNRRPRVRYIRILPGDYRVGVLESRVRGTR